jgi:hypothetical protein
MTIKIEYDEKLAKQVEQDLKDRFPNNKWSEGYICEVIKLCCQGDDYFYEHHGAFDLYLARKGLVREYCENCGTLNFKALKGDWTEGFCNQICEMEYYGAQ